MILYDLNNQSSMNDKMCLGCWPPNKIEFTEFIETDAIEMHHY